MTEQGRPRPAMSVVERRALLDDLVRQGYSPEEAELALQDSGLGSPTPGDHPAPVAYPAAYAQPGVYAQPAAYAQPGVPAGVPPVGYPVAPATGRTSYLLGLLAWLPVPIASAVVAGVAMVAAYPRQRRTSPLAAENARAAANWGATCALGTLLSFALTVGVGIATTPEGGGDGPGWVVALPVPILVLAVMHLVITVRGLRRTGRGEVYRPLAVPFFRAARP